ncbi:MAG TPA: dihydropteroate synthase, partial [bacterium]|nr:dihydropteroate synthase [bacterium]
FTDVILMGTKAQLDRFVRKMKQQPDCFNLLVNSVELALGSDVAIVNIGSKRYDLSKDFVVIGILNMTPDSFSDGGKFFNYDSAMKRVEELVSAGANVIDVGGESTRPDSNVVTEQEEMERVLPIVKAVRSNFDVNVSIDSYKPQVIKEALKLGATLVNDISAGSAIEPVINEIQQSGASVLAMMNNSTKGVRGETTDTDRDDPVGLFMDFCQKSKERFLNYGLDPERLIMDPGIGFGLSINDTSNLLHGIGSVTSLGFAVCAGISRKSYVGKISGLNIDTRDPVCNAISLYLMERGVKIFRTHDPEGLKGVIKAFNAIQGVSKCWI